MKHVFLSAVLAVLLVMGQGCKKDSDTVVDTPATGTATFSTANIKTSPVYFSFDAKDTVKSTQAWDVKFTTMFAPDDSTKSFAFPGVALNRALNVQGKIVDGTAFEAVNAAAVSGLATDKNDSTYVIGTLALSYDPASHKLSPYANRVFVIKTASGKTVKFRILSYYNTAGASGYVTFEYQY